MASLARDYHENLQHEGLQRAECPLAYDQEVNRTLREIPRRTAFE
jgi:hypothetical protein